MPPRRITLTRRQALGVAAGGAAGAVALRTGLGALGRHDPVMVSAGPVAARGAVLLREAASAAPWHFPDVNVAAPAPATLSATAAAAAATTARPSAPVVPAVPPALAAQPPGTGPTDPVGTPVVGPPIANPRLLAAHLLRRAGFGATSAELDAAAAMPYAALVDQIVSQQADPAAFPTNLANADNPDVTGGWWMTRMATTTTPFPERMGLFWHGLLTSDYRKVTEAFALPPLAVQNHTWRTLGLGDLRTLLTAATRDAGMMYFLDLQQSTGNAPNENYSRELMELFTLGAGNFTETDVREGARALAGYRIQLVDQAGAVVTTVPQRGAMSDAQWSAVLMGLLGSGHSVRGVLDPRRQDTGVKRFLGRTGNLGLADVVDAILAQPAAATYIARKALIHFSVPAPSEDYVARMAAVLRSGGYQVRPLMTAIFTSPEFIAQANYRSLMRSPVDFVVAATRAIGRTDVVAQLTGNTSNMGQRLYDPPTVAGWPSNGGWVSSGYWLQRFNTANQLANMASTPPADGVRTWADGLLGPDTQAAFARATTDPDRWYAVLASPEFHVK